MNTQRPGGFGMMQLRAFLFVLGGLFLALPTFGAQRNLKVAASTTQAQKRVALVIGNAAYQGALALRNPVNDARAMSTALNGLGFEVIEVTDASQKEMNRAITAFGSKLTPATAALFFYAGHGLQVKGRNFIIPVDAQIESEAAVASEAVSVDAVLEQLNTSTVSIVILDACRNNPFERSFRKMGGGGLAQMDAPKGSFIAYATAPGKTAADGEGKNGLFTQELLKQINEPGLDLERVFKRVRANVAAKSGDAQMPWDSSSMTGDFYFRPGRAESAAAQPTTAVPPTVVAPHAKTGDFRPGASRLELALVAQSKAKAVGVPLADYGEPGKTYRIERSITFPGDIERIAAANDADSRPFLSIALAPAAVTRINGAGLIDRQIALVLDGRTVLSAAVLRDPITANLALSGNFSLADIQRLVEAISPSPKRGWACETMGLGC